jgi:hypothetical protein
MYVCKQAQFPVIIFFSCHHQVKPYRTPEHHHTNYKPLIKQNPTMPRRFTTTNEAAQLWELDAQAAIACSLGITKPQPVTLPEPPQDIITKFATCFDVVSMEATKATNHTGTIMPHTNPSVLLTAVANQGGGTAEPRRFILDAHGVIFGGRGQVSAGQNSGIEPPGGVGPPATTHEFLGGLMEGRDAPEG